MWSCLYLAASAGVNASLPEGLADVGTAMTSRACGPLTHQARAIARMSPHGLSPSLYLRGGGEGGGAVIW